MKGKKDKDISLKVITMMDLATGWIETCSVPEVIADLVVNQVKLVWLIRHQSHNKIIMNRGK